MPTSVLALLISETILIFCCYVLASFFVLDADPVIFLRYDGGLARIALVVICVMIGIYFHDLYTQFRIRSRILLVQQLCLVVGIAFLTQALLSYLRRPDWILPKWMMIAGSGMALVLLPAWRMLYASVVIRAMGAQRVLFLGTSSLVRELSDYWQEHPELGLASVGYLSDRDGEADEFPGLARVGSIEDVGDVAAELMPDRIVVGLSERRIKLPVNELLDLRFSGLPIEDALATYEASFGRICIRELHPSQLIFAANLGPRPHRVFWQSIYSFGVALVVTIVTLPVIFVTALAVRLSSKGPVFFRQTRVGRNGVPFTLYKFRSMFVDAESRTGAVWATKDDPRITPVGRWIRKLRIDELPQLFNVVRGEMSIVGPRPERPEFVRTLSEQIPYYRQRHYVKPGITGWAQINHKYGDTIEDTITKLEYDLYYIKNLAPSLDAYIIFHTLKVMLLSRGAQ
ncbi:MAG TPA: sugar transferase [Bryobacteraceae bacterium]|nr:sugar transferase [Bryobacteraceae bacterium]